MEVQINVKKWLSGHPEHSYKSWKQRMAPRQSSKTPSEKSMDDFMKIYPRNLLDNLNPSSEHMAFCYIKFAFSQLKSRI